MSVNTSSIYCKARETVPGTAEIIAADTASQEFGGYADDLQDWEPNTPENEIVEYWTNAARKVNLVYGKPIISPFVHKFNPCSPLAYYEFLGYGNTGAPATVTMRNTGKKDAYTIRHEEREGTNQLIQNVGSYCVALQGQIEMNKDEMIAQTWINQSFEDNGDRVSLTTLPIFPESIESVYSGKPTVTWDVGGGGEASLPEVFRVLYGQAQNFTVVGTGSTKTINLHEYSSVELTLAGILSSNTQWNALVDRTTHQINVRSYKQNDLTKYKDLLFYGCKIKSYKKLGKVLEGAYLTTLTFKSEYFDVNFVNEFGVNFANWFVEAAP